MDRKPNRLVKEKSPYLLQHAYNPVGWYAWGEEAFAAARAQDKPIFLSVGYASCHWCHVMERESFQDEDTAAFLNEHFVSIKVDREERPDVDGIYMDAVQLLSGGQGGWPMSVFLTPDGRPFFAGTYFPKEPRFGMPSFLQVLHGVVDAWRQRRDDVVTQGDRLRDAISRTSQLPRRDRVSPPDDTARAFEEVGSVFDRTWGGIEGAPKFPQPMLLEFLLRMAIRGLSDARDMVSITLQRMASGGIHDQLGGGFCRYSTDARWHVPHFEKMLYDNAQLAQLYARAWLVTRDERCRTVSIGILDELLREMRHPEGAFYSSQDADTDGVEGAYFTWSWDELVELVGPDVATALGATPDGNWQGEHGRTNVLWHPVPVRDVAAELGRDPEAFEREVEQGKETLLQVRERRSRPAVDDKVLAAWNGLAVRAFAEAGRVFGRPDYIVAATRAADFVWRHLRDGDRLLRAWRDGAGSTPAFADDHALVALGYLTLHETTGDEAWFERARMLGDTLLELFHDADRGGFFQTGTDATELIVRPKEIYDNAVPSGNSAGAELMLRLSMFTGEARYEDAGAAALNLVSELSGRAPMAFGHALSVLDLVAGPRHEVAIIGDPSDPTTQALVERVTSRRYLPNVVLARGSGAGGSGSPIPLLRERTSIGGKPTAYVCQGFMCDLPTTDPAELERQLDG